jgi:hypothetical protein
MKVTASCENKITALLSVSFHHVAAFVQPSLLNDLPPESELRHARATTQHINCLGFARLPEENVIDREMLLGRFNCSGAGLPTCDRENNTHINTGLGC